MRPKSLDQEDPDLERMLLESNVPVAKAAAFYRAHGYTTRHTVLTPEIIDRMRDVKDPDEFLGDMFVALPGWASERHVEVKQRLRRDMNFTCAADYPMDTIMVDNCHKVDRRDPAYHYFIFNRDMTHAVVVLGSTRPLWTRIDFNNRKRMRHAYVVDKSIQSHRWVNVDAALERFGTTRADRCAT